MTGYNSFGDEGRMFTEMDVATREGSFGPGGRGGGVFSGTRPVYQEAAAPDLGRSVFRGVGGVGRLDGIVESGMNGAFEEDRPVFGLRYGPGPGGPNGTRGLGWSGDNPIVLLDANLAAPSESGKQINRDLQAFLRDRGFSVQVTGFLDKPTVEAWRDWTADKSWYTAWPGNFNVTNILDTIYGADSSGHFWVVQGERIVPDPVAIIEGKGWGGHVKAGWGFGTWALLAGVVIGGGYMVWKATR
jgi:hypothetical protein